MNTQLAGQLASYLASQALLFVYIPCLFSTQNQSLYVSYSFILVFKISTQQQGIHLKLQRAQVARSAQTQQHLEQSQISANQAILPILGRFSELGEKKHLIWQKKKTLSKITGPRPTSAGTLKVVLSIKDESNVVQLFMRSLNHLI